MKYWFMDKRYKIRGGCYRADRLWVPGHGAEPVAEDIVARVRNILNP